MLLISACQTQQTEVAPGLQRARRPSFISSPSDLLGPPQQTAIPLAWGWISVPTRNGHLGWLWPCWKTPLSRPVFYSACTQLFAAAGVRRSLVSLSAGQLAQIYPRYQTPCMGGATPLKEYCPGCSELACDRRVNRLPVKAAEKTDRQQVEPWYRSPANCSMGRCAEPF